MDLLDNPFNVLHATQRDSPQRLLQLFEERTLVVDEDRCRLARSDLTNPRKRLAAEVAWLPGVSPKRVEALIATALQRPLAIREQHGIPTLAHANLYAAALKRLGGEVDVVPLAEWIGELAALFESITAEETQRLINEDRSIAGFPEVMDLGPVEEELRARRRHFCASIREALNGLPVQQLVRTTTAIVASLSADGESQAPVLIDDLVDTYEIETASFLEAEANNVRSLIAAVTKVAGAGREPLLGRFVDKLEQVLRNWDSVAQPIQVSAKSRGVDHAMSVQLATEVRSLAVDLFNDHGLREVAQRLTTLLQEVFAEVPKVEEKVDEDAAVLARLQAEREEALRQARKDRDEWAREITYETEIGLAFKERLRMSPAGIDWKGRRWPLDEISRVAWGGVRQSINGIPTGTNYTIGFGTGADWTSVGTRREEVYREFTSRLWKAVGGRLLTNMLQGLRQNNQFHFGDAIVRDRTVLLPYRKLFAQAEWRECPWSEVKVWSADGCFCLASTREEKTRAAVSYLQTENVHVLETAIRMNFQKGGTKLSDLLQ